MTGQGAQSVPSGGLGAVPAQRQALLRPGQHPVLPLARPPGPGSGLRWLHGLSLAGPVLTPGCWLGRQPLPSVSLLTQGSRLS